MSDTALSPPETLPDSSESIPGFLSSNRARKIREAAFGYIFLLPAFVIIFVFGIFPLFFALYQCTRDAAEEAFNAIMQGADIQATLDDLTETANELQEELMSEVP